jgi:RND superfamily putative drug exporter
MAKRVTRRPYTYAVVALVLLITLGSPFLRASFGLTDDRVLPPAAPAHLATQEIRTQFDDSGARAIPVLVQRGPTKQLESAITDYAARVSALPDVERVDTATGSYANGRRISLPNRNSPRFSSDAAIRLDVIAKPDPMSAAGTKLVHDIRQTPAPATVLVGGTSAMLADTTAAIGHWAPVAVGIIVLSMFVLLFLFTRSVFLPFKALLLTTLSLTATFGAMVFVFQEGHLGWLIGSPIVTGLIDVSVPILVFCIAFGLSMDYQVFLISRIRERYLLTGDNVESIAVGLGLTGRIITSAACILAIVLIVFATSGLTLLKLVGVGLAIAVVIDATVVRTVLVPAFMKIAGRANWWAPRALRQVHVRFGFGD